MLTIALSAALTALTFRCHRTDFPLWPHDFDRCIQ